MSDNWNLKDQKTNAGTWFTYYDTVSILQLKHYLHKDFIEEFFEKDRKTYEKIIKILDKRLGD